jgi:hypothetical protein
MMVDPSRLRRGRLVYGRETLLFGGGESSTERGDSSTEGVTRLRRRRFVPNGETHIRRGRLMYRTLLLGWNKTDESFAYTQLASNQFSRMLSQQVTNFRACSANELPILAHAQPKSNQFSRLLSIRGNHNPFHTHHLKYAEHTRNVFLCWLSIGGNV